MENYPEAKPMAGPLNPMWGRKHKKKTLKLMSLQSRRFWAKKKHHEIWRRRMKSLWDDPEWAARQRQRQAEGWERRKQRILAQSQGGSDGHS